MGLGQTKVLKTKFFSDGKSKTYQRISKGKPKLTDRKDPFYPTDRKDPGEMTSAL